MKLRRGRYTIMRKGWHEALEMIAEGWQLLVLVDGHAELLSPKDRGVPGGKHSSWINTGSCAEYYLTARSVQLLRQHQKKKGGRLMPGEVSRPHPGTPDDAPYVPHWCFTDGPPKQCACGHHEGYHTSMGSEVFRGACLHAHHFTKCGCTGFIEALAEGGA